MSVPSSSATSRELVASRLAVVTPSLGGEVQLDVSDFLAGSSKPTEIGIITETPLIYASPNFTI